MKTKDWGKEGKKEEEWDLVTITTDFALSSQSAAKTGCDNRRKGRKQDRSGVSETRRLHNPPYSRRFPSFLSIFRLWWRLPSGQTVASKLQQEWFNVSEKIQAPKIRPGLASTRFSLTLSIWLMNTNDILEAFFLISDFRWSNTIDSIPGYIPDWHSTAFASCYHKIRVSQLVGIVSKPNRDRCVLRKDTWFWNYWGQCGMRESVPKIRGTRGLTK